MIDENTNLEISKLQKDIIETDKSKVVILASAGSGKTFSLTERVRYLLRQGVDPSDIVVITFTNAAAFVLKERLGSDYKDGLRISTIHSYANYLLNKGGISTSSLLSSENFDGLFHLIKKNRQVLEKVRFLLLDEAQDSSKEQFQFLIDMIKPENYFLVGDLRQSIFGFAKACPTALYDLTQDEEVTTYPLNENYRNGKNILDFAKRILFKIQMRDDSIPANPDKGEVFVVKKAEVEDIVDWIKSQDEYRDWFILTRTNQQLDSVRSALVMRKIPTDTFKKAQLADGELNKRMAENTVKILTIHTAKGLQNKNVIVIGAMTPPLANLRQNELASKTEEYRVNYVAATRAKKTLIWVQSFKKPRW